MKRPASVISVQDGEIVVDANFLAAGLGLSTHSLKAEMRRGLVYSVAERGIDEDEGRTRLTFRYRARSWTVAGTELMTFLAPVKALPRPESRKFPVFSLPYGPIPYASEQGIFCGLTGN
jgi:hypothetical protein